jgi:hypothetical protein
MIRNDASGLPFPAPEVAVLFRAKAARGNDCVDCAGMLAFAHPDHRGGSPSHGQLDVSG